MGRPLPPDLLSEPEIEQDLDEVVLGMPGAWAENVRECSDHYTTKVGGQPDFPIPLEEVNTELLKCAMCNGYLGLVAQVYAPLNLQGLQCEERILYIFGCPAPMCGLNPASWRTLRFQKQTPPHVLGESVLDHAAGGSESMSSDSNLVPLVPIMVQGETSYSARMDDGGGYYDDDHDTGEWWDSNAWEMGMGGGLMFEIGGGGGDEMGIMEEEEEEQGENIGGGGGGGGFGDLQSAIMLVVEGDQLMTTHSTPPESTGLGMNAAEGAAGTSSGGGGGGGYASQHGGGELPVSRFNQQSVSAPGSRFGYGDTSSSTTGLSFNDFPVLPCFYIYSHNETRTVHNRRGGRGGHAHHSSNSASEDTTGATGGEIYEDGGRNGGGGDDDGLGDRGDDDDGDNFLEDELGEADDDSWGNEDYENNRALLADRTYMKFKRRLDCYPEQCLRSCFQGHPLWASEQHGEAEPCPRCGGPRVYELQLMPPLLYFLQQACREGPATSYGPIDWEWLTLLVFTCAQSCTQVSVASNTNGAAADGGDKDDWTVVEEATIIQYEI